MRIIAGEKKGMNILGPIGYDTTRPITDRVKESVFNVLQKFGPFDQAFVADVFSGTGSMGLEALSRGAAHVTFVDKDAGAIEILKKNLGKGNWLDRSNIIRGDAFKIGAGPVTDRKFDFIFIDPPYALAREAAPSSQLGKLIALTGEQVNDDGVVIVRTEKHVQLENAYGSMKLLDSRRWGTMSVGFFQLERQTA